MKRYFQIKKLFKSYSLWDLAKAGIKEVWRKIYKESIRSSFAQNGEDLIIEKYFPKNFVGRYLEIGAYHPKRLSNTYRFYKKGWRGVVVEPNPEVKKIFKKYRPEDKFLNFGIGKENGRMEYYQFLIPALNTFSKKAAQESIKEGHKLEKISLVKVKKIDKIIDSKINFLSVDTEGFDELILQEWKWKKARPEVICAEVDKSEKIKKILERERYRQLFANKDNAIFVCQK